VSPVRGLGFALALGFALGAVACSGPKTGPPPAASGTPAAPSPVPAPTATTVPVTLRSKRVGSHYIYLTKQKDNRKVYVLRADSETGQYFGDNTGRSDFVRPHVTFFAKDGSQIVADAPAGTLVEKRP
jgi:hypothetical protein